MHCNTLNVEWLVDLVMKKNKKASIESINRGLGTIFRLPSM